MKEEFKDSYSIVIEKLESWFELFMSNLPNIAVALLVFVLTYFISGWVRRLLKKSLKTRVTQDSTRSLIATTGSVAIVAMGLFIALGVLNLGTVVKSLLAGAGVAGLAIGLALQSTLSNTFSGVYLSVKEILNIGDWVETNGFQGTITEVNLRNTILKEADNNLVIIPNKDVVQNPFKNFGLTKQIRVILKCGVGYESDLEQVEKLTKKAISENFQNDESKEIEFHYLEFGDSSINFQVRFWIDAHSKLSILEARSKAIKVVKKAFDEQGINIPFPIRTVYMKKE